MPAGSSRSGRRRRKVGFVTSGGYGHTVGKSLAMAMVDRAHAPEGTALSVHVVGVERPHGDRALAL
jgi:glycine cleavage system aminomethyltransferase T